MDNNQKNKIAVKVVFKDGEDTKIVSGFTIINIHGED